LSFLILYSGQRIRKIFKIIPQKKNLQIRGNVKNVCEGLILILGDVLYADVRNFMTIKIFLP